ALDWLVALPEPLSATSARTVDLSDVARIRSTTNQLDALERQVGGDHCRQAAGRFLQETVLPMLTGRYSEVVGRELYAGAAVLCELIGWMAYDSNRHGIAQRYFVQGLRLAREAGDTAFGAYLLTSMSHQSLYLGRPRDALRLAQVARDASERASSPAVM